MPAKQFIRDLKDKQLVHSVFLTGQKQVLKDKNGDEYLSIDLHDITGCVQSRMWERVQEINRQLQNGDFVRVKGHVQVYQSRKQIVIHDVIRAQSTEFKAEDFLKASSRNANEMFEQLQKEMEAVRNPHLRRFISDFLNDSEMQIKLKVAPASRAIHHAYLGGLLEHVLSILSIVKNLSDTYSYLDRDLLYFGALFHDIGKLWELQVGETINYTDEGRLVGHLVLGYEWFDKKSHEITGFPNELRMICKHILLSHHNKTEWGSPKQPTIPEAYCLAMADLMDSQLNQITSFMRDELTNGEKWTRYHDGFERQFYLDIFREKMKSLED